MRRFSWAERELIANVATSVKWAIEISVESGVPFEQAKADRIKQAETAWRGLSPDMAQAVRSVCWSISPADLSKRTHRAVKDRLRQAIEDNRGKPMGWIERTLHSFTGMSF